MSGSESKLQISRETVNRVGEVDTLLICHSEQRIRQCFQDNLVEFNRPFLRTLLVSVGNVYICITVKQQAGL